MFLKWVKDPSKWDQMDAMGSVKEEDGVMSGPENERANDDG